MDLLPEYEFKQSVRVSKETFKLILEKIENHPVFHNNSFCGQTDVRIQLALCPERFGCYGNRISSVRIARAYGVGRGTVSLFTMRVIKATLSYKYEFLSWPSQNERKKTSFRFASKYGFPGCVGVVDGTHIILDQKPSLDPETYWTRKQKYALNAQVVCNDARKIIFFQEGWPGSVFDCTCLGKTSLIKKKDLFFLKMSICLVIPLTYGKYDCTV